VFDCHGIRGSLPEILVSFEPGQVLEVQPDALEHLMSKHQDVVLLNQWDRLSARLKG
jgi:hypothetical protein